MWTLQWLQRQWEKTVEERRLRRHCQQWRNCREEMKCTVHNETVADSVEELKARQSGESE